MKRFIEMMRAAALAVVVLSFGRTACAYTQLGNDRVLLMNNDLKSDNPISGQGYDDTDKTLTETYWWHENYTGYGMTSSLKKGRYHVMRRSSDDVILWYLHGCRAGSATSSSSTRNNIPYSSTSRSINSPYGAISKVTDVGSVIMRNTTEASVYSPYYEEGIGTVFFDIVNCDSKKLDSAVKLQIAVPEDNPSFDLSASTTNFSGVVWKDCKFDVLEVANKSTVTEAQTDVTELELKSDKGQYALFYRVRAALNVKGPVRFRIIRSKVEGGTFSETASLVLVDNILVSYPCAEMSISFYNEDSYDSARTGANVQGYTCVFTEPFLAIGATNVYPRGYYSLNTNGVPNAKVSECVLSDVTFAYRWCYLGLASNDWQTVPMQQSGTNLVSKTPLDLKQDSGDIEYFLAANVSVPHYDPVDYAFDTAMGYGSWTEGSGAVTNRLGTYVKDTRGTDYFTRLREGESMWERLELVTVRTNGTKLIREAFPMELTKDHTWKAYYYIPATNAGQVISYSITGYNRQQSGTFVLEENSTNWYHGAEMEEPHTDIAYSEVLTHSPTNWGLVKLDDSSTHLLFEFNDETASLGVSRANYQNFNAWTDAAQGFMGNYQITSGVTDTKTLYTAGITNWDVTTGTNSFWSERFVPGTGYEDYPYDTKFSVHTTPNGWTAKNGRFVAQDWENRYGENDYTGDDAMALQMNGNGEGTLEMNLGDDEVPKGLDRVIVDARCAQVQEFDDFAYSTMHPNDSTYVVSAQVALSLNTNGCDVTPVIPTASLVANYKPSVGCYEFRMSRIKSGDTPQLELAIYKWYYPGTGMEMASVKLASKIVGISSDTTANYKYSASYNKYGFLTRPDNNDLTRTRYWTSTYLAVNPASDGKSVYVKGAICRYGNYSLNTIYSDRNNMTYYVDYKDTGASGGDILKAGSFGVGSSGAPAYFGQIQTNALSNAGTAGAATPSFSSSVSYTVRDELNGNNWYLPIGRMEKMDSNNKPFGYSETYQWGFGVKAIVPSNELILMGKEYDGSKQTQKWSEYKEMARVTVQSFTTNQVVFAPGAAANCSVQLATGSDSGDVVVDNVDVYEWRAQDIESIEYKNNEWVYLDGWITEPWENGRACKLQPRRGVATEPMGLRSPLLTNGLSLVTITYTNAQVGAKLLVQVATNGVTQYNFGGIVTPSLSETYWTTMDTLEFTEEYVAAHGSEGAFASYLNLRGVTGAIRVIMDPGVITASTETNDYEWASIEILSASCYDEPPLDTRSWWGWNLWTTGWLTDGTPGKRAYLTDGLSGLSLVLNNSGQEGGHNTPNAGDADYPGFADADNANTYRRNDSFIQGPTLSNGIGQVTFRARKDFVDQTQPSIVTVYGSQDPQESNEDSWKKIAEIEVTARTYKTYSWKTLRDSDSYKAVRLRVTNSKAADPTTGKCGDTNIVRVAIDEVVFAEAVKPSLTFAYACPIRTGLIDEDKTEYKANAAVGTSSEQPLTAESWGVQVAIEAAQMTDEDLDLDSIRVYMATHVGLTDWGTENWLGTDATGAELVRCGKDLVWRSTYLRPDTIVLPNEEIGTVVQFHVWATYRNKGMSETDEPLRHDLGKGEWVTPTWYWPIDLNDSFAAQGFSAYTILSPIAPHRAWINEVNYYDGKANGNYTAKTNQFIEVAAQQGKDLQGWYVRVQGQGSVESSSTSAETLFRFGSGSTYQLPAEKSSSSGSTNHFVFFTARSPKTAEAGHVTEADGTWRSFTSSANDISAGGVLNGGSTYGLELVRPSLPGTVGTGFSIVEHQIVIEGTNIYAKYVDDAYLGSGTNLCAKLLRRDAGSQWIFTGADDDGRALGVFKDQGQLGEWPNDPALTCWTNLTATPGKINAPAQVIDPTWYVIPNGTNVYVYAYVEGGHLTQLINGVVAESGTAIIIPEGRSTNITYQVTSRWYEIGSVTTNDAPYAEAAGKTGMYVLQLNDISVPGEQKELKVVAKEATSSTLAAAGVTPEKTRYYDAIMDWLETNYSETENDINPAEFVSLSGKTRQTLTLEEMYWLNINPVEPAGKKWYFYGGFTNKREESGSGYAAVETAEEQDSKGNTVTNLYLTVKMMLSNECYTASSPAEYQLRAPTMLRGLAPKSTSTDYSYDSPNWTSVTFRVRGALQNGSVNDKWQSLRWLVFGPNSFDTDFCSRIRVVDPFSSESPVYSKEWWKYRGTPIFYSWAIGDASTEFGTVEMLKNTPKAP